MIEAGVATRFAHDVAALLPDTPTRIGLAVSGGPDSLALLLLAHATLPDIVAATVDHGLRPEAAEEAQFVAEICANIGVDHSILTVQGQPSGNPSAWARRERYQALDRWRAAKDAPWILTAHHADDQLETLLMRLNRGSGVGGLAGIRAVRAPVARPLLGWRKSELVALVESAGLIPVDDPSNRDDRYNRARMRDALADVDWLDPLAAARSAEALASADSALDWAACDLFDRRVEWEDMILRIDAADLPFELQRRLTRLCLNTVQPDAEPRDDELVRLVHRLRDGQTATLAGVKCVGEQRWAFKMAPPPRSLARNS